MSVDNNRERNIWYLFGLPVKGIGQCPTHGLVHHHSFQCPLFMCRSCGLTPAYLSAIGKGWTHATCHKGGQSIPDVFENCGDKFTIKR